LEFRKLRLAGFKSFVEPAELRIEPGLTGVVGPNGCGKSNLLEALRWVMGEGSPKSMRSGGMDDVIFAGTGTRPARAFAQVTLGLAGAAGEEIEVSRKIERGTGSDYRVNGRDARAQDVRLLFADSATGAHSPAIVGQGRISSIIAAKPAERRMLLEEAAGIAGLHVRRREAEIRLRAAEANVLRLDDVIRALEIQANALRRQAKIAERYRTISDRLKIAEASVLYARWKAAMAASENARKAAAEAESRTGDLTRIAAMLTADATNASAGLPDLRMAEAAAAATVQALQQSRALLDAESVGAVKRRSELQTLLAAVARDAAREALMADDAAAADARLAAESAALAERLAAAEDILPRQLAGVEAAVTGAATAESQLGGALDAHATASAQARAAADAVQTAAARLARAEAEARELAARLARLAPAPDTGALAAAVEAATAALAGCESALAEAEAVRPVAEAARAEAAAAHAAARATLASLAAEGDALAKRLAADSGKGPRIADLVETRAGYEAAMAAALGDDLDAGPADSDSARRWAGAVSFDDTGPPFDDPALPEGVVALADLVTAPPELARRLAQIGVVEAAPAPGLAARLRPGQRLVTMAGALWRWDGYVDAGGRNEAAAARLRARRRAAEVDRERAGVQAQLDTASAALAAAVAAAARAQEAERAARGGRDGTARGLAESRARFAAAETAASRRAGEAASLQSAIERSNAERARLIAEAETARALVPGSDTLAALASELAAARARAEAVRAAVASGRAAFDAQGREIDSARRRIEAIVAERSGWQRRREASAGQQAELAMRADVARAEQAGLATREAEIARDIAGIATKTATAQAERVTATDALARAEAGLAATTAKTRAADEAVAAAREARATARAEAEHQDGARADVERLSGERFSCPPPVLPGRFGFSHEAGDPVVLAEHFEALTEERERLGPVNLRADIELAELEAQAKLTDSEKAELDTAIARLRGSIGSLNREGRARLAAAFIAVDGHFRTLFCDLFGGGEARLELIESDDPLEAGLEIMAQPPGKKLQSLTLLSGGEQALTATALIFALFLANPAPICVLDEVDAPLDDANVERFCDLLDRMATDTATRFLIVTHNTVTMSRMHRLYGVTMGEPGVSQLVSVDLQTAGRMLAVA
jgi:chromosome segregation protein